MSSTPAICTTGGADGSSLTLVATGTCSVQAAQAGNNNYLAAPSVTQTFTVGNGKADQTITFVSLPDGTMLQSPVTVSATASSGLAVSFTAAPADVCKAGGRNGAAITLLAPGTCSVTASQSGGSSYNPAATVTQSFTVTKASQTIAFAALASRRITQSPFTVSATASSGLIVTFTTVTPTVCTSGGKNGATISYE